ncbi:MAG: hypothetical protein ACKOBW_16270, partial [Planctomycetota bacterium]
MDSIRRFQHYSLWELHRGKILAVVALLTLQSTLLIGFFGQRWRRRRAERSLRETQDFLKLAGESAELGIWSWDLLADQMAFNVKCAELLRLGPFRQLPRREYEALIYPEDRSSRELAVRGALERRQEYELEY